MRIPVAIAMLAAGCAGQPLAPGSTDDAASLAAAESAFAAHSVREDMRVAFLANFAPDGVYVRKGWTVARADLESRSAPPIVLDWHPAHTEVAASGEMGLSTGPWKITRKADPSAAPVFGQFVSIWKREPGGPWKVAVDIGISNPRDSLWDAPLEAMPPGTDVARDGNAIAAAEERFQLAEHSSGVAGAYRAFASRRIRFYREGLDPAVGRDAALVVTDVIHDQVRWIVERSEVSRSGDFGYSRGHYTAPSDPGKVLGYFLRVWRPEDGGWRIVMDVANPAS